METIKQEACGLVFSDINLSLPVDHFYFKGGGGGGDGRKPVGLQTPAINFPIGISRETRNNEAITNLKRGGGGMGLKVTSIQKKPTLFHYKEVKENPPELFETWPPQKEKRGLR